MAMPVAKSSMGYQTFTAPPLEMDSTDAEVQEPLLTAVSVNELGRSPTRSGNTVNGSQTMTPSEREIFEIYENVLNSRHSVYSENIDPDLLQRILSSLSEIGQLGR